jgi:hypothetical protein
VDRNHRRLGRLAALWGVLVLSAGCQEQITNPESLQIDPQDAVVHAIPARPLPLAAAAARLAGLDIEARFRTIAVPFPSILEVGTCFTQVTKRDRPVPFALDRVAFEAPQAAIDEADGATIVLEYRFLARSGRIIEAARCRVPKSQLAIDQVFGQFTEHGLGARRGTLKAALAKGPTGLANGWVVSVEPGSFLPGGVVATMSGDGLCGTEENPCILDGVETEQCDSGWQEWNEDLNECYCANGSTEWDCWLDPGGSDPNNPGPGPGDGGGSSSPPGFDNEDEACRPYTDPDCVHRYMGDWSQGELIALQSAIYRVLQNGCHDIANKMDTMMQQGRYILWDARLTSSYVVGPRYGRYAGTEPNEVYSEHALIWSGAGRQPNDGWNIYRTFVHETMHALGTYENSHFDPGFAVREAECLGDMYSPKGNNPNHDIPHIAP